MSAQASAKPKQLPSWFARYGTTDHPRLVGQIFFPTNVSSLDANDRAALDALVDHYEGILETKQVEFTFTGNADLRGSDQYNLRLGMARATAVKAYVDEKLRQRVRRLGLYSSIARSLGESQATLNMAGDRRVDIVASYVSEQPIIHMPPDKITIPYTGPLSNRFKFRTLSGGGLGIPGAGFQVCTIEICNSRTHRTAQFTYTGAGPGIGLPAFNRETDWEEKTLEYWLDVDDFEGNGRIFSGGVGAKVQTSLVFYGPKDREKSPKEVQVDFEGWDVVVGVEFDPFGYWWRR